MAILHQDEKNAQAMLMLQRRVMGDSLKEIAQLFNCSPSAVSSSLRLARKEGMVERAREIIAERLVPKALATLDNLMEDEDVDAETRRKAAVDVLFGSAALQKKAEVKVTGGNDADTLEAIRTERLNRLKANAIDVETVKKGE